MESQVMLGIVLCVMIITIISTIILKLATKNESDKAVLTIKNGERFSPSKYGKSSATVEKFGRYKVKLSNGQNRTLVGNLSTILENNSVESFHEIK